MEVSGEEEILSGCCCLRIRRQPKASPKPSCYQIFKCHYFLTSGTKQNENQILRTGSSNDISSLKGIGLDSWQD